jgi:uncharacterized protein YkwD
MIANVDAVAAALVRPSPHRRRLPAVAAFMALALLAVSAGAPAAAGAAAVDPLGDELMRLTNLDRTALGKAALAIDPTLAGFARDRAVACPTKPAMTVRGRAQDMADRDYFSHYVTGCLKADGSTMSALDVVAALGYRTSRGENIAKNSYGGAAATYKVGCALDGTSCRGSTPSIATVAAAQQGFMRSSGHRANILGSYDRFGCGSAVASDGWRYYACVFSLGGPAIASTAPAPVAAAPDIIAPAFVTLAGAGVARFGYSRTLAATVSDAVQLASLELRLDGRLVQSWTLGGTAAERRVTVASASLPAGRHQVRWTVRDAAGNARSVVLLLLVR